MPIHVPPRIGRPPHDRSHPPGRRDGPRATGARARRLREASVLVLAVLAACGRKSSPATDAADPRQVTVQGLVALGSGESELDRDRWDPAAVVAQVGRDPDALYRWVSRNTRWIPYRGVLRGPVGVLNDRLGNSIDRALLLAAMLQRAGDTVRLAHVQLPAERVRALLPPLVASQLVHAEGAIPLAADEATVREVALDAGEASGATADALLEAQGALARAAQELASRTRDQGARLVRALPRPAGAAGAGAWAARAAAALADHWWVQRLDRGAWVDMDLLADSAGKALPGSEGGQVVPMEALATAGVHQEIAVRVITEYTQGRRRREVTVFDYPLRPADALGEPIVLQFVPGGYLADSVARADLLRHGVKALQGEHQFGAMLLVGSRAVAAGGIAVAGETAAQRAAAEAGPMGGLASAFGESMGDRPKRAPELTAAWIEYEFRVPGEAPRRVRRDVFDLVGPAARASGSAVAPLDSLQKRTRALAMLMRTELLPVACRLAPAFVTHLALAGVRGNATVFAAAAREPALPLDTLERMAAASSALPTPLLTLAVARLDWSPFARDLYIDRAGLLTRHQDTRVRGDTLVVRDAVDIVANDVGVGAMVRDPWAVRVGQGVFDTNAEALLWQGPGVGNVGEAFASSPDGAWKAIPAGPAANAADHAGALDALGVGDDLRQRLRDDLAAGASVVATAAPVQLAGRPFGGWWRVDPLTGTTLGMGSEGWGVQGAEYSQRLRQDLTWSQYFLELARIAAPNFAKAFGQTMAICMAQTAWQDADAGKLVVLGARGAVSHGVHECTGDAIIIAGMATVPLFAITMREMAAIRAARLARLALTAGEVGNVASNSNPAGKTTKPGLGNPEAPGTRGSDPGNPALDKTQPQGNQNGALDKTQPQGNHVVGNDPNAGGLDKTVNTAPDATPAGETSPLAKTGQNPLAQTMGDAPPPSSGGKPGKVVVGDPNAAGELDKTGQAVKVGDPNVDQLDKTGQQPPPEPPFDPSKLTPGRQKLLEMEHDLVELWNERLAKQDAAFEATQDYIRYASNSPEFRDPTLPKGDPAIEEQLYKRANAALNESILAEKQVLEDLGKINDARRSYRALSIKYGQIPTTAPEGFIGCPPNCRGLTDY